MKYDFSKLKVLTVDGVEAVEVTKALGNAVYTHTRDIELGDKAREIYKAGVVELSQTQVEENKKIVNDDQKGLLPFAARTVVRFLETE
jgi:diphthamide biosynthesis methyltransferase